MTTTANRAGSLTGTARLIRFALRRDRVKLPAWVLGIALIILYYASALPVLFGTEEKLQSAAGFLSGPVGKIFGGPGYGFEHLTIERFLVAEYGLYVMIAAALMSILLVSRHTRVEEQSGRAELVLSNGVGRDAPLAAALVVALIANLAVALLVGLAMISQGFAAADSMLFGVGVGAAGMSFAGIAAVAAQVTEFSRAASGIGGLAIGAAFAIRAAGDLIRQFGSPLSWFSPLAWAQQTRPFVAARWWPLLLSVGFTVAMAGLAYLLSRRRDYGAGLLTVQPGAPTAAAWLDTPLALAYRLHRASIIGWSAALLVSGFVYGALTQPIVDGLADMSEDLLKIFGGGEDLVSGYLAAMGVFEAVLVAAFVVLGVQSIRSEETKGRVGPVLATATSRWRWMGGNLAVLAVGSGWLLLVTGVGTAVGAAVGTGRAAYLWEVTAGHVSYVPGVLVILAVAALLFGVVPRAVPITWVLVVYGMIMGFFAPLMDLPQWVLGLSPLDHIALMPVEAFSLLPLIVLTALAAGGGWLGLAAFRRRDLAEN
jgi:ABC-2 type transport system permease protein